MGSWKSNRWSAYKRRNAVEDHLAFSTTCLRKLRLTDQTEYLGAFTWTLADGNKCVLDFNLRPNYEGGLWLYMEKITPLNTAMIIDQQINMHATVISLGGRRWWMECPIVKGHAGGFPLPCAKRCAVLYLNADLRKFGCRQCFDLAYRSSQQHDKTVNKYMKNPEAYRQKVEQAYEKILSLDEQMGDLRKEGLFKGIGQAKKGSQSSGGSGGTRSR